MYNFYNSLIYYSAIAMIKKKQSSSGMRCVGAAEGLQGVMEVTPYGPDRNFGGVAAPDFQKLLPPTQRDRFFLNGEELKYAHQKFCSNEVD